MQMYSDTRKNDVYEILILDEWRNLILPSGIYAHPVIPLFI